VNDFPEAHSGLDTVNRKKQAKMKKAAESAAFSFGLHFKP
jgi:hypothetical protein